MGLRPPSVSQGPQGLLPFDFDATDGADEVTGRAGLPLLLETMMALHVGRAVKQHLKLRKRNAGFSEAEMGSIKYLGIVSNDFGEDCAAQVRWHYRKAGCIEVVHDVVKNELGGGVLPCAAFGANAAWFRLCLLTYNLLSAMKVLALPPPFEDARPKRLRFAVFNLPARLVSHARKLLARVAQGLLERADMLVGRARLRTTYAT